MTVKDQEESNAALLFELLHEFHLMGMDILQGKGIHRTFLGIKAYRDPLYCTDIINSTLLLEKASVIWRLSLSIFIGVMGVGIFWIRASPASAYFSLVRLTISSSVDPRSPRVFHVAIFVYPF